MVDGPELKWTEGDRWHAKITLPSGTVYEYKYVVLDSSGTHALNWQRGNNSVLAIKQVTALLVCIMQPDILCKMAGCLQVLASQQASQVMLAELFYATQDGL